MVLQQLAGESVAGAPQQMAHQAVLAVEQAQLKSCLAACGEAALMQLWPTAASARGGWLVVSVAGLRVAASTAMENARGPK